MIDGRQYGYLTPENNRRFVRSYNKQQVAGYSVGILYIEEINYPLMPGNVVNAYTYDFPVRMKAVQRLTNTKLFNADKSIEDDIMTAAKQLVENEGVRAICSACGFFGNYHRKIAGSLNVPVALSSLVQLPWIRSIIGPEKKIGILTANASAMTPELFYSCCAEDVKNVVIKDAMQCEEFSTVVNMRGYFDNGKASDEVVGIAKQLVAENENVGAILLECSDMPPYAYAVQEATQLPVFDFITLIRWLHNAATQRPYSGWI